jgi:DNA polymerase-1
MEVIVARTKNDAARAAELLSGAKALGCDTETSGLSPSSGRLLSIQFSDGKTHVLVPVSEDVPAGLLSELLETDTVTKIFHNARFDLAFLKANGIRTNNLFDTMLAEKILTKGANQSVSLAETLYRYFAIDLDKSQRKQFGKTWNGNWTEELILYAMNDVAHLPRLMREQTDWLERLALKEDYETLIARTLGPA